MQSVFTSASGSRILRLALPLLLSCAAHAETFELGGMYTYHYRDGRYADWGDLAREGAWLAVDEVNDSGMLGDDVLSLKPEEHDRLSLLAR